MSLTTWPRSQQEAAPGRRSASDPQQREKICQLLEESAFREPLRRFMAENGYED